MPVDARRGAGRHGTRTAGFFSPGHHVYAVLRSFAGHFAASDAAAAFRDADRLCRVGAPGAQGLLARSMALGLVGRSQDSLDDLAAALAADSSNALVQRRAMEAMASVDLRRRAALDMLSDARATQPEIDLALACLHDCGHDIMVAADRSAATVAGWVAWSGPDDPSLRWIGERHDGHIHLSRAGSPSSNLQRAAFEIDCDPLDTVTVEAVSSGGTSASVQVWPVVRPPIPAAWRNEAGGRPSRLSVIVPVYRDLEATRDCLDALGRQRPSFNLRVIVVDDRSPEPEISALAEHFCAHHGAVHIVNRVNLGFAGSVNKALSKCLPGDVLLLNADVVLGDHALERLASVAHGDEAIGTVMPMSNDSAATSVPDRNRANPMLSADQRRAVDDAAWRAHGPACVDVFTNIGFCLYIRQPCLRDVGLLSPVYGRGYYEDVEFCLAAAERGYRNVAAIGIYVGHASGRSFQDQRPTLVARNASLITTRFLGFRLKEAVASEADPLRPAWATIEERLRPSGPVHLLVGRAAAVGPLIEQRVRRLAASDCAVLRLDWAGFGDGLTVTLGSPSRSGPRSLAFRADADGAARLTAFLSGLSIVHIALCEIARVPAWILRSLPTDPPRAEVVVASRELAVEVKPWRASPRVPEPEVRSWLDGVFGRLPIAITPADPMARRFFENDKPLPAATIAIEVGAAAPGPFRTVGIIVPLPQPCVDLLILALARALDAASGTEMIVIGSCVDDLQAMTAGNVHVSGPVAPDEHDRLLAQYGVEAVFSPYRTSMFGVFSELTAGFAGPRGYFDWSGVRGPCRSADLVMDWDVPQADVATAFATWCRTGSPAARNG